MIAAAPGTLTGGSGRPLRVLLVTTSMSGGGAERQVYLLARELRRRGHTVALASMVPPERYVTELADLGVELTSLGMTGGVPDPRGVWRLARTVRRWRPDVVHSHMVHANLLTRLTRLLAPMPVQISTAHSLNEGARWRMIAYRVTDPLCTLTTNVCRACVERYVRLGAVPARRIRYVPNGIELEPPRDDRVERASLREQLGVGDAFVWLAVGRMDAAKDYPTMVRAVARLPQDRPSVVLVAGGGPEYDAVEALGRELGVLGTRLQLLGQRSDVPQLLAAADAFVMSSVVEGLSLALMEAAAKRLPAVATAVGGNPEVVLPDTNGVLVPPRDSEALATAMGRVMTMPPEALQGWGRAARQHVEATFEIGRVVARWEALYGELLQPAGVARARGGRP
jgi:glycosyltransferase involved in cell wall biosynthesis